MLQIALARQIISNQYKNQGAAFANQFGDMTLVLGDWRRDLVLIPPVP